MSDYSAWDKTQLISRIAELEKELKSHTHIVKSSPPRPKSPPLSKRSKPVKARKTFDPTRYTTRLIALKFSYLGAGYNGYEHHVGNKIPLPTIEEEIWKALVKTRLISPPSVVAQGGVIEGLDQLWGGDVPVDWEGCEYSKCGRTDAGVSAFGQVISIRVRSAQKVRSRHEEQADSAAQSETRDVHEAEITAGEEGTALPSEILEAVETKMEETATLSGAADEGPEQLLELKDELPYIELLNNVLPPAIRILAWCPQPPSNFSARFSCKERKYRYFFTNPAFLPVPGVHAPSPSGDGSQGRSNRQEGWLDVKAMQEAANHLVGLHDYRNLCKVDPTKQLTNFKRRITHASIDVVSGGATGGDSQGSLSVSGTELLAFTVRGSAFLWHQVRCMVGVIFLVGQGLEKPTIVKELLDVTANPCRPQYEMADDRPLVLWECTFSNSAGKFAEDQERGPDFWDRGLGGDELEWVYAGDLPTGKWNLNGLMESLWKGWRATRIDEVLAAQLLDMAASQGGDGDGTRSSAAAAASSGGARASTSSAKSQRLFRGDDQARSCGVYVPMMKKEKMDPVEVINARYLARKELSRQSKKTTDGAEVNG